MKSLPALDDFRRPLLWLLLVALIVFRFAQGLGQPLAPAPTQTPVVPAGSNTAAVEVQSAAADAARPAVDIFAVRTWEPLPPPAPPVETIPVPPPRPQAPALPFRFLGKISEPGEQLVFLLAHGERVISVSVGDAIGKNYLVEKHEGDKLYFMYKPLKVRQSISVGRDSS